MEKNTAGAWRIPTEELPTFGAGRQGQEIPVGGDGKMLFFPDADRNEFEEYLEKLSAGGYRLYAENQLGGNRFATFAKADLTVNAGFDPTAKTVRIVMERGADRPPMEETADAVRSPLQLIQMGLSNITYDAGMAYVIRLEDGRVIVIDGGAAGSGEYELLYRLLCKIKPNDFEKPIVACWFLTHSHGDHAGAFLEMMMEENHAQDVTVQRVVYNFPTEEVGGDRSEGAVEDRDWDERHIRAIPNAGRICARTGQRYVFPGVSVNVLFVPEEAYPNRFSYENDNSVVLQILAAGQVILMPGDSERRESALIAAKYGSFLKADILQVAHHGYWAGGVELNRLIDPTVLLWPCQINWFHEATRPDGKGSIQHPANDVLLQSPHVKQVICHGFGTYVLDLPYEPKQISYAPTYREGDVIYSESFENLDLIASTPWYTVGSNKEKREPMGVSLETRDGKTGALLVGKSNSVLGIVSAERLYHAEVYTLELNLTADSLGEGFAVQYNNNLPEYGGQGCSYPILQTGTLELKLTVDRNAGRTEVWINGVSQPPLRNRTNEPGGIQFRSDHAKIFVRSICVRAGK